MNPGANLAVGVQALALHDRPSLRNFLMCSTGVLMKRSLYASRPNPYYILAPNFRKNSAGIRVLHMLCDALIRSGQEAYVTADGFSPALMTPPLNNAVLGYHKAHGIEPIVIYPEVVDGNPYESEVVVRYLLNSPGLVGGQGCYDDRDILYAFTQGLLLPGMPEQNVLFLQPVDLSVFRPPADPAKRIPGKVCFYQGRSGSGIDESRLPPDAIRITTGFPSTWEELVDIFQTCEFFYSASTTALSAEAALCGCIGVVIPGTDSPLNFSAQETGSHGVAWGDSPHEIDRARRTLPLLRESLEKQAREFWPALDHFIRITQEAAAEVTRRKAGGSIKEWLSRRTPSAAQARLIEQRLQSEAAPCILVVIIDTDVDPTGQRMRTTLHSLAAQRCPSLALKPVVVSSRGFSHPDLQAVHFDGEHLVGTINQTISGCVADWFVILRAGDELTDNGLTAAALDLIGADAYRAVYSDLIMRQSDGESGMLLRPSLNIDLLLSLPVTMVSNWLFRRENWLQAGTFDGRFNEAFEFDYILRLVEEQGFSGIAHLSEPLLASGLSMLGDRGEERQVIERHLRARGFESARVERSALGSNELDYRHAQQPKVSILLTVMDDLLKMKLCLALLLENAAYEDYEILFLDQGGSSPPVEQWLSDVDHVSDELMRVVRLPVNVSLEQARNAGALQALGEFVIFMDPEVSVLGRDWVQRLLNHGLRPEVGAVGPKIVKPDGTIYSAGLHLGLKGPAGTAFSDIAGDDTGYLLRLQVDQNYSALSGKCLMVRRESFMSVGGFDESPQLAIWADVDLCLKLQQAGFLNVWTPHAKVLFTNEKETRFCAESNAAVYAKWLAVISNDPVQSPNVSLRGKGFELEMDLASSWQPTNARPLPVVMVVSPVPGTPNPSKALERFDALKAAQIVDGIVVMSHPSLPELCRYAPDVLVLQYPLSDQALVWLRSVRELTDTFTVLEVDALGQALKGARNSELEPHARRILRQCFDLVDRVVVPNASMADALSGLHEDIHVVPARLSPTVWGNAGVLRGRVDKLRVGYVSERGRQDTLQLIADTVRELADKVTWVFLGECPDTLRPFVNEVHSTVGSKEYPQKLAALNLDLAVVPSAADWPHEHASELRRVLEFGACGVPVICSHRESCVGDWPVTVVGDGTADWVSAIESHIGDVVATAQRGSALRAAVLQKGMWNADALQVLSSSWLPDPSRART